jgi:hypothetical protein
MGGEVIRDMLAQARRRGDGDELRTEMKETSSERSAVGSPSA